MPPQVAVVIDEAYNEYLPAAQRYDSVAWLARHRNLVLTRTFSKAYGLAGLRVGFALCDEQIADLLNRVRQPFNVNNLALVAAAAALGDGEFVRRSHELNLAGMAQLAAGCERLGLAWIPSYGNFVSVEIPRAGGAARAGAVFQHLLRQGVIVRPVAGYGMPDHLRVTVGLAAENERVLHRARGGAEGLSALVAIAIEKLVVVGVGLIGASFALALREAGAVRKVVGVGRSRANLERALAAGAIDETAADAGTAADGADFVLVATPVAVMADAFASVGPHLPPGAVITDGGSTERSVIAAARGARAAHRPVRARAPDRGFR